MKIPRFARRRLESLGRHLTLRRRLPARFGRHPLWVTPAAAVSYFGSLDRENWRELYDLAEHHVRPGMHVWDVGANVGVFAFAAAHHAGPTGSVVAIEADPWLVELLRRSAAEPGVRAPVEPLCVAAAEACDLRVFATTGRTRSGSHLDGLSDSDADLVGPIVRRDPVVTVTLDWLAARRPAPAVVKIDVEGAEALVLRGAEHLLSQHRPIVLFECHVGNIPELTALFARHRYRLIDYGGGEARAAATTSATYNTLALPT